MIWDQYLSKNMNWKFGNMGSTHEIRIRNFDISFEELKTVWCQAKDLKLMSLFLFSIKSRPPHNIPTPTPAPAPPLRGARVTDHQEY